MAEITYDVNELPLSSNVERLNASDTRLIGSFQVEGKFNPSSHIIELHAYDQSEIRLLSNYAYERYRFPASGVNAEGVSTISLDPVEDATTLGFPNGDVRLLYHFLNNLYSPGRANATFYVETISPDRTELRLLSSILPDFFIQRVTGRLIRSINFGSHFSEIRLNFRGNDLLIGVNISSEQYRNQEAVLIRLYEPLPATYNLKDEVAIVELVSESRYFEITATVPPREVVYPKLASPNFSINELTEDTEFLNTSELKAFEEDIKSISQADLGIDYSRFENFIQFSSTEKRIELFENKKKRGVKNDYDHFDRFLDGIQGSLTEYKERAILFDATNANLLLNTIPIYLREDESNEKLFDFVHMLGHYFDNLWVYQKELENRFDGDSRLNNGLSRDLVKEALRSFGIQTYSHGVGVDEFFKKNRNRKDYIQQIYKRIYHNTPLLLKSKGTKFSLDVLLNCFGYKNIVSGFTGQVITGSSANFIEGGENILSENVSVITRNLDERLQEPLNIGVCVNTSSDITNYYGYTDNTGYRQAEIKFRGLDRGEAEIIETREAKRNELRNLSHNIRTYSSGFFRGISDFIPAGTIYNTGTIICQDSSNISWYQRVDLDNYDRPRYFNEFSRKASEALKRSNKALKDALEAIRDDQDNIDADKQSIANAQNSVDVIRRHIEAFGDSEERRRALNENIQSLNEAIQKLNRDLADPKYQAELDAVNRAREQHRKDANILLDYEKTAIITDNNFEGAIDVKILGSQFGNAFDSKNPNFETLVYEDTEGQPGYDPDISQMVSSLKSDPDVKIIRDKIISETNG